MRRVIPLLAASLGGLALVATLTGCAVAPKTAPSPAPTARDLGRIGAYYDTVTAPHRRAVRKPIRDQRDRALRQLSDEAARELARVEVWGSDVRVATMSEDQRPAARQSVAALMSSLQGLKTAADRANLPSVRTHYRAALAAYARASAAHVAPPVGSAPSP